MTENEATNHPSLRNIVLLQNVSFWAKKKKSAHFIKNLVLLLWARHI